jgi:hypothetical protein
VWGCMQGRGRAVAVAHTVCWHIAAGSVVHRVSGAVQAGRWGCACCLPHRTTYDKQRVMLLLRASLVPRCIVTQTSRGRSLVLWVEGTASFLVFLYSMCLRTAEAWPKTSHKEWSVLWYALRHDMFRLPR